MKAEIEVITDPFKAGLVVVPMLLEEFLEDLALGLDQAELSTVDGLLVGLQFVKQISSKIMLIHDQIPLCLGHPAVEDSELELLFKYLLDALPVNILSRLSSQDYREDFTRV